MAIKYVIRRRECFYTDEGVGHDLLPNFYQFFDDFNIAQKIYYQMVIRSLREEEFELCDNDFIHYWYNFIDQKLGDSYSILHPTDKAIAELSDEDLLEFACKYSEWITYVLLTFEDQPLYAVWDTSGQKYLISSTFENNDTPVILGEDGTDIEDDALYALIGAIDSKLRLFGSLEELSNSPELLRQFLSLPDTGIIYDAEKHVIEYSPNRSAQFRQYLHTFNSLLKQPIYELHPIRPDQIKQVFENQTVKIA